jgi:hypothetical protein
MKPVAIIDVKFPIRCDFFMCPSMAVKDIANPDGTAGQGFRVCQGHFDGMKHALSVVDDVPPAPLSLALDMVAEMVVDSVVETVADPVVESPVPKPAPKRNAFVGGNK